MTLPLKWAVEITSHKDAETLWELYPNALCAYGDFMLAFEKGIKYFEYAKEWNGRWFNLFENKPIGYTIYTITELEQLLNK